MRRRQTSGIDTALYQRQYELKGSMVTLGSVTKLTTDRTLRQGPVLIYILFVVHMALPGSVWLCYRANRARQSQEGHVTLRLSLASEAAFPSFDLPCPIPVARPHEGQFVTLSPP